MEEVILVNENDEATGTSEKLEAHRKGLLHRAFSVFIFNDKGDMLLQQRAFKKYHSGGLWSNACCGHPRPNEDIKAAAHRRLFEELGIETELEKIFDFTYRVEFENGLIEYEYDHVFTGIFKGVIDINKNEAEDFCFKNMDEIALCLKDSDSKFTEWFHIAFSKLAELKRA